MTCIVGLVENGTVYIGGDSAATGGGEVRASLLPKVFELKCEERSLIIGYTSSFRMGQLLQHILTLPPQKDGVDTTEYMVRVFSERVRQMLKEYGFSEVENNKETGGFFLVGYRGHLYSVGEDFQVNEYVDGMAALGSGREYALGSLKTLTAKTLTVQWITPRDQVEEALHAASYFNSSVREPFIILSNEDE